jgi:hypothetical protein
MAPITDDAVNELKKLVSKLESRISELEGRLDGGKKGSAEDAKGIRLILMGPPGAGTSLLLTSPNLLVLPHCGWAGRHDGR